MAINQLILSSFSTLLLPWLPFLHLNGSTDSSRRVSSSQLIPLNRLLILSSFSGHKIIQTSALLVAMAMVTQNAIQVGTSKVASRPTIELLFGILVGRNTFKELRSNPNPRK